MKSIVVLEINHINVNDKDARGLIASAFQTYLDSLADNDFSKDNTKVKILSAELQGIGE